MIAQKKGYFAFIVVISIVLYIIYNPGKETVPVEQLDISSGIGFDMKLNSEGEHYYSIPTSFYIFTPEEKTLTQLHIGEGKTMGQTRENRQLKENNKFTLGLAKIIVFSEDGARHGIRKLIDILNRNAQINDISEVLVSEQSSEEILGLKMERYPSSADYLEGMIKNAKESHFFSDNYKLIDMYVKIDAEGRKLTLPYVTLRDGKLFISGTAVFDKDKMKIKLDLEESKTMNIMRENKVNGMLFLGDNINEHIDFTGKTERKVDCQKLGDKYSFKIDVKISGDIVSNRMYKDIENNPKVMKKFEKDMAKKIQKECYEFIEKMQKEYRLDCLDLGAAAASKYGRHTDTDWNQAVSEADIKVNIKIKVDTLGRGRY